MTTYVALLYSIILAAGRRVVMADLRAMAEGSGLHAPRTLVATGNLVFETRRAPVRRLEGQLETAFEQTFGRHVDIIVRSAADWRKLVAGNPFPHESETDAERIIVRVMRDPVEDQAVAALERYATDGERVKVVGGDLWIHFPRRVSQSKLAAALTPRRIGIGTSRNWNTVRRLGDMVG